MNSDEARSHENKDRYDDAVLGRAVRRIVGFLFVIGVGAAAFFLLRKQPATGELAATNASPSTPAAPAVKTPEAKFTDITTAA